MRICPVLGITRHAFLFLDKKQRNEIKQVPFFVPASFRETPSKRVYEQAEFCNLLFLDIDELPDGRCPAAPFVANPDALYTALDGLNFAAHTTASSTEAKPRMRIVVEADEIPVDDYPKAVATLAARLGLSFVTKESKVAVQPMFLPTLFSDTPEDEHPLIAHRLDGRAFTIFDITATKETKSNGSTPHKPDTSGTDALFFLRAPVPEITLAIAKEALNTIGPDCSYFEWLECAAALKHQFSPHKEEEAYELFDEWSANGSKYTGADDTRAKWNSLRATPVGRMPVTIRSLLRQAVASGWDDKKVKDDGFTSVQRWMEETPAYTDLMDSGVRKIMALPLLTSMQEDSLIQHLCKQAKKRFAQTISSTAVRRDIAKLKAEIRSQEKPTEKTKEPLWAKGVCYVNAVNHFYRHRTGEKYKPETFNASYSRWLLPTEESLKEAGIPVTPATLSKPIVQPSDYALNHLKIPTVYDYAYDPAQPTEMFFVHRGRKYVNTYSATYPELDQANAARAGNLLTSHLGRLIAEADYARTVADFMAYMVQQPGRKIRWAVFIQSAEGAGKTFLAQVMRAVLGKEHVRTIGGETIGKGWTEWSFGSQLVVVEEVRANGTNRHATMNVLKKVITNDEIPIDQRNRDTREVENICNYMLFSNHHDALALTPGDRRYFVVKSPLQSKSQVLGLGDGYFIPLYNLLRDNPGALRAFLMNHEISPDFNPDGHAPRTSYVMDMVNDSANELTAAVRRLLLEGDFPLIQYDIVSSKQMVDTLMLEEGIGRVAMQAVSHALREEGFRQVGRYMFNNERHYIWTRRGDKDDEIVAMAQDRLKNDKKNLQMEKEFA